jgi:hypothetical protein
LFEVFIDKFKLLDHLSALKNFLLLGHGDFADQLMETLGYLIYYPLSCNNLNISLLDQALENPPTASIVTI